MFRYTKEIYASDMHRSEDFARLSTLNANWWEQPSPPIHPTSASEQPAGVEKRQAVTSAPLHISTSHTSTRSVLRTPHLTHCQLSICHISANCGRIRPAHRLTRMLGAPSWYMGALLGVRVEGCQSGVCTRYAAERLLRREWCSLDVGLSG